MTGAPTPDDQVIGTGDGMQSVFALAKYYGDNDDAQHRPVTRPVAASVRVAVDGAESADWTLADGGRIVFAAAPDAGARITAGFLFDVPVRFAEDRLSVGSAGFMAGEIPSVPLVEIREPV